MTRFGNLAVLVVAAILAVYFLADDSPVDWLVRLAFAGAITAGLAVVVFIVSEFVDGRRSPP